MSKSHFNLPELLKIFADCALLGQSKNHDYGAVRDTIAANGLLGVVTRMDDKMARILSLTRPGHESTIKTESLRDTLKDQINYSAYAIMIIDLTWGLPPAESERILQNMGDIIAKLERMTGKDMGDFAMEGRQVPIAKLREFMEKEGSPISGYYASAEDSDGKTAHYWEIAGMEKPNPEGAHLPPPRTMRAADFAAAGFVDSVPSHKASAKKKSPRKAKPRGKRSENKMIAAMTTTRKILSKAGITGKKR